MSLILEALRKSEAERRLGQGADIHVELAPRVAPAGQTAFPGWTVPAVGMAILAGALWWALANSQAPVAEPAAVPQLPQVLPPPALPAVDRLRPPRAAAVPPTPTDAAPRRVETATAVETPAPIPAPQSPAAVAPIRQETTGPAAESASRTASELSDLSATERKSLPTLKLSMHMWDSDPSRRFVILDGQQLGEGDRIGEAVVARITSDGVVLDWNGRLVQLTMR